MPESVSDLRASLPPQFLKRIQAQLGAEYPAFLDAYAQDAVNGLRVNLLKLDCAEFTSLSQSPLPAVEWFPGGFFLPPEHPFASGKHPYHAAGLYYLQEPAAMAPAALLQVQPGERILDLSAAPGGKSTQIAAQLNQRGLLVANEIHPARAWALAENLERWGARNATITQENPERLAEFFGPFFDRVLVDAPCSGEGMFRKSKAARQAWSPQLVLGCAQRQKSILRTARRLVRPGGVIVYSTCTFSEEENEQVLDAFLKETGPGRFEIAAPPLRLWPHKGEGEGHFAAALLRVDDESAPIPVPYIPRSNQQAETAYAEFARASLSRPLETGPLLLKGSYLYSLPLGLPNMAGLNTIHPGLWLGVIKKGHRGEARFEPAHALALALKATQSAQALHIAPEDTALLAYLRGENIPSPGENGWVLVTAVASANSFPLGWGKRVQGVLKNAYPRGLRLNIN